MSWLSQIIFWNSVLIGFILVIVWCWSLEFYLWWTVIWGWVLNCGFWFDFVLWEVFFVARRAIEWYLSFLVSSLRNKLWLDFWWFHIMQLIRGYSLKFDRWSIRNWILIWFEDISVILGILCRFNTIRFILIFIGALAHEGDLIQYFALRLIYSYSITFEFRRWID